MPDKNASVVLKEKLKGTSKKTAPVARKFTGGQVQAIADNVAATGKAPAGLEVGGTFVRVPDSEFYSYAPPGQFDEASLPDDFVQLMSPEQKQHSAQIADLAGQYINPARAIPNAATMAVMGGATNPAMMAEGEAVAGAGKVMDSAKDFGNRVKGAVMGPKSVGQAAGSGAKLLMNYGVPLVAGAAGMSYVNRKLNTEPDQARQWGHELEVRKQQIASTDVATEKAAGLARMGAREASLNDQQKLLNEYALKTAFAKDEERIAADRERRQQIYSSMDSRSILESIGAVSPPPRSQMADAFRPMPGQGPQQ